MASTIQYSCDHCRRPRGEANHWFCLRVGVAMPRKSQPVIILTHSERRALLRLLGKYQDLLESSMGAVVIPGTDQVFDKADQSQLAEDHRDWAAVEALVLRLEGRARRHA